MKTTAPIATANWDYAQLAAGLTNVDLTALPKPSFDTKKVQAQVENKIATEYNSWSEDGTLYSFEIHFKPNQSAFTADEYKADFDKLLKLSQTFGGAVITVEGHNDPLKLSKMRAAGAAANLVTQVEQGAKNLSLVRAQAVKQAYIDYTKSQGLNIDPSQLTPVGLGVSHPKITDPTNEGEWLSNMRVVIRLTNVQTEDDTFTPAQK